MTRAKEKKIEGIDIMGDAVPVNAVGALYQMVEGDPTNQHFQDTIQKGAQELIQQRVYDRATAPYERSSVNTMGLV